jgi:hypothetical protein
LIKPTKPINLIGQTAKPIAEPIAEPMKNRLRTDQAEPLSR